MATAKKSSTRPFIDFAMKRLANRDDVFGPDGILPANYQPGEGRLLVITGDNASGKSFAGKWLLALNSHWTTKKKSPHRAETMLVGMSTRTASGFQRAIMFGDE